MIGDIIDIIGRYHIGFLNGLWVTIKLFLIIALSGIGIGVPLGMVSYKFQDSYGKAIRITAFVLGGIPLLVFLMWMHYPLQAFLHVVWDPFWTAALTLSFIGMFSIADLVHKTYENFPGQYWIAAKVCGLNPLQTFKHIEAPLLFRDILPGILIILVTLLHATLFASLISVEEIFRVAQRINASIYKPVEIYTALGLFFLAVSLPIHGLAHYLKNKFTRNLSEK